MVKGPRAESVTTTAQQLINYDKDRTILVIYNPSVVRDVYWGLDNSVTTTNGMPIVQTGFAEFSVENGDDPRLARWLIAAATTTIRVSEERYKPKEDE